MKVPVVSENHLLTTRLEGEERRRLLEGRLVAEQPDNLEIDFGEIEALTISFGDEFVGRLLTELQGAGREPFPLLLTGLNEETATEIDAVLERRKLLVACRHDGAIRLLGGDRYLKATFGAVVASEGATTGELARTLKTTVQNVNNRLKRLVDAGALRRERMDVPGGGKEFRYEVPRAFDAPVPV